MLSFWSLNHANQPEQVFREVRRVLRSGGRFLIVLEDMEPRWHDITNRVFMNKGISYATGIFARKLLCSFGFQMWSLQSDHIRIQESDIQKYISQGFEVMRRAWISNT